MNKMSFDKFKILRKGKIMKNNFQKKDRKAFTIVELVIVIAVIAILAAVLIPTFSNIIKLSFHQTPFL